MTHPLITGCQAAPYFDHASVDSQTAPIGGSLTYSCDPGYMMEDGGQTKSLKCEGNSNWEDVIVVCKGNLTSNFIRYKPVLAQYRTWNLSSNYLL